MRVHTPFGLVPPHLAPWNLESRGRDWRTDRGRCAEETPHAGPMTVKADAHVVHCRTQSTNAQLSPHVRSAPVLRAAQGMRLNERRNLQASRSFMPHLRTMLVPGRPAAGRTPEKVAYRGPTTRNLFAGVPKFRQFIDGAWPVGSRDVTLQHANDRGTPELRRHW